MINTPWFHQLAAARDELFLTKTISVENFQDKLGIKNPEEVEALWKHLELNGELENQNKTLYCRGSRLKLPQTLPLNDLEKMLAWQTHGISNLSQILCVLLIAQAGKENITPTGISKKIHVCTAAMTGIRKQLEKAKLITKTKGINGRTCTLILSGEGARLILSIYGNQPIW